MSIQNINIGLHPNDGTGDTLRDAFKKINDNFEYISPSFGNILFVSPEGNNSTAIKGSLLKTWSSVRGALLDSTSGDMIYVLPGVYSMDSGFSTIRLKDGVDLFFSKGTKLIRNTSSQGNVFFEIINGVNCKILGFGEFYTGNSAFIYPDQTTQPETFNVYVECDRIDRTLGSWEPNVPTIFMNGYTTGEKTLTINCRGDITGWRRPIFVEHNPENLTLNIKAKNIYSYEYTVDSSDIESVIYIRTNNNITTGNYININVEADNIYPDHNKVNVVDKYPTVVIESKDGCNIKIKGNIKDSRPSGGGKYGIRLLNNSAKVTLDDVVIDSPDDSIFANSANTVDVYRDSYFKTAPSVNVTINKPFTKF